MGSWIVEAGKHQCHNTVRSIVDGVIDLKLFLKTSNEGILSRGTWVTFAALRQSSIWPTTSPHLLFYVLLLSLQKQKAKLILELFIFIFDFSCNKRVSQSFFLSASKLDHSYTKLMESIDYFPYGQTYQNTKHITTNV